MGLVSYWNGYDGQRGYEGGHADGIKSIRGMCQVYEKNLPIKWKCVVSYWWESIFQFPAKFQIIHGAQLWEMTAKIYVCLRSSPSLSLSHILTGYIFLIVDHIDSYEKNVNSKRE